MDGSAMVLSGYCLEWAVWGSHNLFFSATSAGAKTETAPLILTHLRNLEVGQCRIERDSEGLYAEAIIYPDSPSGVFEDVKSGLLSAFSADIAVPKSQLPKRGRGGIDEWSVSAVSLVSLDHGFRRVSAKQGPVIIPNKASLVDVLRSCGVARNAAERIAAGGWPAISGLSTPTPSSLKSDIDALTQSLKGALK